MEQEMFSMLSTGCVLQNIWSVERCFSFPSGILLIFPPLIYVTVRRKSMLMWSFQGELIIWVRFEFVFIVQMCYKTFFENMRDKLFDMKLFWKGLSYTLFWDWECFEVGDKVTLWVLRIFQHVFLTLGATYSQLIIYKTSIAKLAILDLNFKFLFYAMYCMI